MKRRFIISIVYEHDDASCGKDTSPEYLSESVLNVLRGSRSLGPCEQVLSAEAVELKEEI